jgi:CRISPR-associated protein Cas4
MALLISALVIALLLYVLVSQAALRARSALGLTDGSVIAADDSRPGSPALRSERLGLVGRPDHLLRIGDVIIPVEQKPRATRAQPSHVMQVAAQCALVQEAYGVRPPYGVLVLAGGVQQRIPFTSALECRLLETMAEMRALLADEMEPGRIWVPRKCQPCGYRETCWK